MRRLHCTNAAIAVYLCHSYGLLLDVFESRAKKTPHTHTRTVSHTKIIIDTKLFFSEATSAFWMEKYIDAQF